MEHLIEALRGRRYILVLVSNISEEDALDTIDENPGAVAVCYDYSSSSKRFWTSHGHFKYAVELSQDDIYL